MSRYMLLTLTVITALVASAATVDDFPDPAQFEVGSREWLRASEALKYRPLMHDSLTTNCPHSFDVLHYNITLFIDIATETISGNTVVTAVSEEADLDSIDLDLTVLTVDSVMSGGTQLTYAHNDPVLCINLPQAYSAGDTFDVQVFYGGHPGNEGPSGFGGFYFDGVPVHAFQMGVGLDADPPSMGKFWFPCWDWPCDKATSEYHITVTGSKKVICNGILESTETDTIAGTTTFNWVHDYQIAPHCMTVNAGKFTDIVDSTYGWIRHWVYPRVLADAQVHFENVGLMMEGFIYRYGPYPFSSFGYVMESKGDMEHQTCVTHVGSAIQPNHLYDWLLAHEMGHMWWGDCVSVGDWRDVWLSEGFATYGEALYREYGYGMADYHDYVTNDLMTAAFSAGKSSTIYDPNNLWSEITYEKAACVLHMLRHVVGESVFFDILSAHKAAHEYSYAVTPDFIEAAENVSGQELDWFFDEWIYDVGWLEVEYLWSYQPSGPDYDLSLIIDQVHTVGPVYTMPVDVGISTSGGDTLITVWLNEVHEEYAFTLPHEPLAVEIDPDDWILNKSEDLAAGAPGGDAIPYGLRLEAAPNPFRHSTTIRFSTPRAQRVRLDIFDAAGRSVGNLADGRMQPGWTEISWSGRDDSGAEIAPGTYFCRLTTAHGVKTARIIYIR